IMKRGLVGLLLVFACKGEHAGRGAGEPGSPSVLVVEGDAGAPTGPLVPEKEPNDQLSQAQPLSPPAGVQGKIDKPRDIDLYKLPVGGNDRQTLHLSLSG